MKLVEIRWKSQLNWLRNLASFFNAGGSHFVIILGPFFSDFVSFGCPGRPWEGAGSVMGAGSVLGAARSWGNMVRLGWNWDYQFLRDVSGEINILGPSRSWGNMVKLGWKWVFGCCRGVWGELSKQDCFLGTILAQFWVHLGRLGIILGAPWEHLGSVLGSFWISFGY